jgi:hypothetical protein
MMVQDMRAASLDALLEARDSVFVQINLLEHCELAVDPDQRRSLSRSLDLLDDLVAARRRADRVYRRCK